MQFKLLITAAFRLPLHSPSPITLACCKLEHSSEVSWVLSKSQVPSSHSSALTEKNTQATSNVFSADCVRGQRDVGKRVVVTPRGSRVATDLLNDFLFHGDLRGPPLIPNGVSI